MSTEDANGESGDGEEHECPTCSRSFDTRSGLGVHHSAKHDESLKEHTRHQDAEHDCPTCADSFPTSQGLKCHHTRVHNESLVAETRGCEVCGEEFEYYPSKYDKRFCSHKCQGEKLKDKVTLTCEQCGDEYIEHPSREERSRFCSKDCKDLWVSENVTGELTNNWQGGMVTVECVWCHDDITRHPSMVNQHNVCSDSCDQAWRSEAFSGEDHPLWDGGLAGYGRGWVESKKELVRERDGHECRICGKSQAEHLEHHGMKLNVHHIVRARDSQDAPPELRNDPFNLVSICCTHNGPALESVPSWIQFMTFLPHPPLPAEQAEITTFGDD